MEKGNQISLWELLFSGQMVTSVFVVAMFVLAVVVLYSFFEKYLSLKLMDTEEDDFLDNIADCLYDHRLDSAKDLCKRISSPEARIIRKGLEKIEVAPNDTFDSEQPLGEGGFVLGSFRNGHFYHFLLFRRFFGLVR